MIMLASCGTPPKQLAERIDPHQVPFVPPTLELDARLARYQEQRVQAIEKQDWVSYLRLTEEIWQKSPAEQHPLIEHDSWIILQAVTLEQQEALIQHTDPNIRQWGWLLESRQAQGLNFKRTLADLQQIAPEAIFSQHLIPELIQHYEQLAQGRTFAVLLPFSDRYRAISEQIRAGILKAYWQSDMSHTLLFFDSQDAEHIIETYQEAKNAGADFIIGPLTRPAIQKLAELNPNDIIALNDIDQPSEFWQFNFRNPQEAEQLVKRMEQEGYRHLALLTTDNPSDTRLSHEIQAQWTQYNPFPIRLHSYAQRNANLRTEMNKILNADQSQSRAAFLSRTLEKPIEFFPRTRQDLQAMILIGDDKQVSVLRPQLDYYSLSLPLYGTSLLTPENLYNSTPNRDLKNIAFPTLPATLTKSPLNNALEAFGWDSFLLASYKSLIAPGLRINGTTGILSIAPNQHVLSQLTWAKYRVNGTPEPMFKDKFSPLYFKQPANEVEPRLTDDQIEAIRLELLQEISQPRLDLLPPP